MRSDPGRHRRRTIRIQGYDYNQAGAYFVTVVTQNRNCVFGVVKEGCILHSDAVRMVEREWKRLSQRFRQVEIMDFVIMPNHLHGILMILDMGHGGYRRSLHSFHSPPRPYGRTIWRAGAGFYSDHPAVVQSDHEAALSPDFSSKMI